jgi:hypothetical protein
LRRDATDPRLYLAAGDDRHRGWLGPKMIVIPASPSLGFDIDATLSSEAAKAFVAAGMRFAIRYVSHAAAESRDLTEAEVVAITEAGLALMVVVHPLDPGWVPSGDLGIAHAKAAVANMPLNVLGGVTVWCDLEGLAQTLAGPICVYVNSWSAVMRQEGFEPGLYVGYDTWLTAAELYDNLTLARYWKSASNVPTPIRRGFCMEQLDINQTLVVDGQAFSYDKDAIMADALGGLPNWLIA